jgi:hypothetical protein
MKAIKRQTVHFMHGRGLDALCCPDSRPLISLDSPSSIFILLGRNGGFAVVDYRPSDEEPVEAFLGQPDRYTHSGLMLSESFSWEAFELVFNNGTVVQKCAVRQALLACISLPAVDAQADTPVRHIIWEKHLYNWLVHVLKMAAEDRNVDPSDRRMAQLVIEDASPGAALLTTAIEDELPPITAAPEATLQPQVNDDDLNANLQEQIEQALKKAFGVELQKVPRTAASDLATNAGWAAKLLARQNADADEA